MDTGLLLRGIIIQGGKKIISRKDPEIGRIRFYAEKEQFIMSQFPFSMT